uniref:SNF2 N-terminal domain-containing protein n=1 Tax=Glossina austeni TaxID=7395 RepID=A0A1A9UNZ3_GLOAU
MRNSRRVFHIYRISYLPSRQKVIHAGQHNTSEYEERDYKKKNEHISQSMKTLMLRRTKAQLQDMGELSNLPQKRTEIIEIELDKDELKVYQRVMAYSHVVDKSIQQKEIYSEVYAHLQHMHIHTHTSDGFGTLKE